MSTPDPPDPEVRITVDKIAFMIVITMIFLYIAWAYLRLLKITNKDHGEETDVRMPHERVMTAFTSPPVKVM